MSELAICTYIKQLLGEFCEYFLWVCCRSYESDVIVVVVVAVVVLVVVVVVVFTVV